MLIDDNSHDNFFHERLILKNQLAQTVVSKESATEALSYLTFRETPQRPDMILLDINMPGMDGWEFIEEYKKLDKDQQSKIIVIMLTTSDSPEDKLRAYKNHFLADFKTKPLTSEMLTDLIENYFG